jgi:hypothetical protein
MVMINNILTSVRDELESSLQVSSPRDAKWVTIMNVAESEDSAQESLAEKIIMSVASIQNDASMGAYKPHHKGGGESYAISSAPLFLDVYVVFTSCFKGANYIAGLALLSRIVSYFQENPVFGSRLAPEIADEMGRLAIEYVSLDLAQSNNLATWMGLKGQPFLVYRLRRLPFDGPAVLGLAPTVRRTPPPLLERSG